jgi:hypothetical protein
LKHGFGQRHAPPDQVLHWGHADRLAKALTENRAGQTCLPSKFFYRPRVSHVAMKPLQGAGEHGVGESREKAGLSDCVHAFASEAERLYKQNLDKAINDEFTTGTVGERFLNDRVYRSP